MTGSEAIATVAVNIAYRSVIQSVFTAKVLQAHRSITRARCCSVQQGASDMADLSTGLSRHEHPASPTATTAA